ncbi:hypothetical protein BDV34DRAFT_162923 [Aspergillus parasiticus]|uniref:Uncharacterized protein n=1 Tax=Aspergillus parasiticus TaxID=5067 RepID=A0A5N6DY87_ASPPA|nr:hypothetical protein BDV34DRAFT_162923 [Aspergillus parasiticus]
MGGLVLYLITIQICITKYWPPKRHISLNFQVIMADRQPLGSNKLQTSFKLRILEATKVTILAWWMNLMRMERLF